MKSLYEEFGGTYTLGDDGMLYPDLVIGDKDPRPSGKWGRMHMKYLEEEHPANIGPSAVVNIFWTQRNVKIGLTKVVVLTPPPLTEPWETISGYYRRRKTHQQ